MNRFFEWVEIPATDFNRAVNFYNAAFELDLKTMDWGTEKMAFFPNGEGAISQAPDFLPSPKGVLVSIGTGDQLDATIQRIKDLGSEITRPKTKIEAEGRGYFATFIDSEGNQLGLYGDK